MNKANPRCKLTAEEAKRLKNLEAISDKLKRGENVQNRQLQTWLNDGEYAKIEAEWQEQLELREELKDEPSDLKRHEQQLKQAYFRFKEFISELRKLIISVGEKSTIYLKKSCTS